ncbi:unnamed protein product [Dracunculus medinensis]|uniref:WYL domain-containing protein n=1 Tax=Dracunculus medinensis TaxID=318479 RepID=A0A0N4UQ25_DRAME|nr:unnamed protein product [Dracunculus medinensis]
MNWAISQDRVYKQLNTYYAECIDDTLFTIGVAVAKGDEKRIKPRKPIDYAEIELSWFKGLNWKMHPEWRYCLLNDSDSSLTAEEAFRVYVEQMRHEGALPRLCESRRQLVDRFIFDMKVTNGLIDLWNYNAKTCKKYDYRRQIHIVFLATPSGLIKYWDEIPEDLTYNDPNLVNISQSTKSFGTPSQQQKLVFFR